MQVDHGSGDFRMTKQFFEGNDIDWVSTNKKLLQQRFINLPTNVLFLKAKQIKKILYLVVSSALAVSAMFLQVIL